METSLKVKADRMNITNLRTELSIDDKTMTKQPLVDRYVFTKLQEAKADHATKTVLWDAITKNFVASISGMGDIAIISDNADAIQQLTEEAATAATTTTVEEDHNADILAAVQAESKAAATGGGDALPRL